MMAYATAAHVRFSYRRLIADTARVIVRAWSFVAAGLILLAVIPRVIVSLPWVALPAGTANTQWIVASVLLSKQGLVIVDASIVGASMAAIALVTLGANEWRDLLRARRFGWALATGAAVNLAGNWPLLTAPLLASFAPAGSLPSATVIGWAISAVWAVTYSLTAVTLAVSVTASLAEGRSVPSAMARSFTLLRGLRWRALSLVVAFLVIGEVVGLIAIAILSVLRISIVGPGVGLGVLAALTAALGGVFDIAAVVFFLQARRITDGPSAAELQEVFE